MALRSERGNPPSPPPGGAVLPGFAILGWRWISRNPAAAIAPVLVPFIFLYFLSIINPPNAPPTLFPSEVVGAMLFVTQNVGSWVLGDSATWRLENRLQDMFIASPLGKLRYLFGIAFSNLIPAVPALAVLAVLLVVVLPAPAPWWAWLLLVYCLLVLWVLFSAIGIMISSRLRSRREVWPVGNMTFTTLGMLSPLYYPLSVLPPLWQTVALTLPGTYAAILSKAGFGLNPVSVGSLGLDAGLLLLLALAGTALALHFYRWRD